MSKRQKRDWKSLISEQEESGLSIDEFCESKGIHYTSFYKNRKKFQNSGFVEIKATMKSPTLKTDPIILKIQDFSLEIPKNFDTITLKKILSVLGSC